MANLISLSRIFAVVCLLGAAAMGATHLCLVIFLYALLSDVVDGHLARALGTASPHGAQLDSIADAALYLTMPIVALLIFPRLRATETSTVLLVALGYAIPITYGFLKYRRLTSYHTTAARIAGVVLSLSFLLLLATNVAWPFRIAAGILLVSAFEEIAITHTLPVWRSDVPSLSHALQSRTALAPAVRAPRATYNQMSSDVG